MEGTENCESSRGSLRKQALAIWEPELLFRGCLERLLSSEGWDVRCDFVDPREFVEQLRRVPPAVGLIGLGIGRWVTRPEGLDVVAAAHLHCPAVPLIALSTAADPFVVDEACRAGACMCLERRLTRLSVLLIAVEQAVNGAPPLSSEESLENEAVESLASLTPREWEVLRYISAGADNLKISAHLEVSERTVKAHVTQLYRKLGAENRPQMALLARELGLLPPAAV